MTTLKTASELKITQQEYDGLLVLMDYFGSEKAPEHVDDDGAVSADGVRVSLRCTLGFNMGVPLSQVDRDAGFSCGTAACVGGHLKLWMLGLFVPSLRFVSITPSIDEQVTAYIHDKNIASDPLFRLFFPETNCCQSWSELGPKAAAHAIRTFLETGCPEWIYPN